MRYLLPLMIFAALGLCPMARAQTTTIRLDVNGQLLEGTPLSWSNRYVNFLTRDGALLQFSPVEATSFAKVADGFRSYSQSEMRGALQREFGGAFQVSGTGHYLVVHPAGQRDQWAPRFEELYRSFAHYFTSRGMNPSPPTFPLVAVVFPTRGQFDLYVRRTGGVASPNVLGYYSPLTNRIVLYDMVGASGDQQQWFVNAETIIHEATHQTAFNTNVHNRYALPPRWVAEGLGTMFEAPGVWNSRYFTSQSDRINRDMLRLFQNYAATQRPAGRLAEFVSSDRPFSTNPDAAYGEAWALTFFLVETQAGKYVRYLRRTNERAAFTDYSSAERLRDFTDVFGTNLALLEAHYLRFIQSLK
jgi:hypothetical protein